MDPQEKSRQMIDWFAGRDLPPVAVIINPGEKITDPAQFVKKQTQILQSAEVMSLFWKQAYNRLLYLKKYLQNVAITTT